MLLRIAALLKMSLKSVALVNLTIVVNNLRCIKTLFQSIAWSFQQQWSCQESAEKEEHKLVQYAACDFCPHFFVSLAYHEQRTYMEPSDSWLKCAMAFPQMEEVDCMASGGKVVSLEKLRTTSEMLLRVRAPVICSLENRLQNHFSL